MNSVDPRTVCDHDIRLDRYCSSCEWGAYCDSVSDPAHVTPVGCWLLAALLVLVGIAAILTVTRPWEVTR